MQYANDLWLSLWVDVGVGGVPVAMALQSDGLVGKTNFVDPYSPIHFILLKARG